MRRIEREWRKGQVLYVEALSPAGRSFGRTYGLRFTPSFALFDGQGRMIRTWTGVAEAPTQAELEASLKGSP
ncbi:hypothetical protein [Thermoflexus sp.]|uniref:hypothetical protein n=1 Tax=Thermoflexus sp. TaxID=1969742 RepID=UPI001774CC43|nr:hypothetical protein [Thermoflexus sp.]